MAPTPEIPQQDHEEEEQTSALSALHLPHDESTTRKSKRNPSKNESLHNGNNGMGSSESPDTMDTMDGNERGSSNSSNEASDAHASIESKTPESLSRVSTDSSASLVSTADSTDSIQGQLQRLSDSTQQHGRKTSNTSSQKSTISKQSTSSASSTSISNTSNSSDTQTSRNTQNSQATQNTQNTQSKKNTRLQRISELLRHIPTFLFRFLRLLSFVLVLLPAFVVFAWHYGTCDRRAVYYGDCGCEGCGSDACCANDVNENGDGRKVTSKESKDGTISDNPCNEMSPLLADREEKTSATNDTRELRQSQCSCPPPFFSRHYLDIYGSRTNNHNNNTSNTHSTNNTIHTANAQPKKPVVIFLTGGAWIIGYKMWGTLLARALTPFNILVIVPDYRNFPRVTIEGMVDDVDKSIDWTLKNVERFGGDGKRVVLVGQSAGGHIGGVVVVRKVWDWLRGRTMEVGEVRKGVTGVTGVANGDAKELEDGSKRNLKKELPPLQSSYTPNQLCGFISTSSPYNLINMREVFHRHGLSSKVQKSIFGGVEHETDENRHPCGEERGYERIGKSESLSRGGDNDDDDVFERWSPYHLVQKSHDEYLELQKLMEQEGSSTNDKVPELKDVFPKLCVIHGTADKTVPVEEGKQFLKLLSQLQIPALPKLYEGWTHTDPILEAPMRGNHLYHRDVYELVCSWTHSSRSEGSNTANGSNNGGDSNGVSSLGAANGKGGTNLDMPPFDERHSKLQSICPWVLVEIARWCNPF